jgi:ABC-type branched-subunit amino acid transport system substrate-binding protein
MIGYTARSGVVAGAFPNDVGTKHINAVISTVDNKRTMQMYHILEEQSIPMVVTYAMAAEMSKGSDYPAKIRIVPSESYDGVILQKMLYEDFGYRKIGIFYTADVASTGNVLNFVKLRHGKVYLQSLQYNTLHYTTIQYNTIQYIP